MTVLFSELVVVAPVQVHYQTNDVESQVALDLHLGNLVGVFFEQNENDLLFEVLPKRIAPRNCEASLTDFSASIKVKDDALCVHSRKDGGGSR
jgi:hypothetical protein